MEEKNDKVTNDASVEKISEEATSVLKVKSASNGDEGAQSERSEGSGKMRVLERKTREERRAAHGLGQSDEFRKASSEEDIPIHEATISPLGRIVKVIFRPGEVFDDIRVRPKPLIPFIVYMLLGVLAAFLNMDSYLEFARASIPQSTLATMDVNGIASMMNVFRITLFVTMIVLIPATILLKSGISHGLSVLLGGEGKFSATLGVISYSYIIPMIGIITSSVLAKITGVYGSTLSAALFIPDSMSLTPIATALKFADVFTMWYLGISVYGMIKVHGYSRGRAAAAILLPFAILVAISVVGAAVGGQPAAQ